MPAPAKIKETTLSVVVRAPEFKWQMLFNAFWFERITFGVMARVAYLQAGTAPEIVSIMISDEGLGKLKESTAKYLQQIAMVPNAAAMPPMPLTRMFTPLFSNHVSLARSGNAGEIAFYTVMLSDIANAARGNLPDNKVEPIHVAVLYSDIETQLRFALELIKLAQ